MQVKNEKISIIMGIYNCQDTLSESIDSIINQTYTNWEFIICDDKSTDNSYEIAKKYEQKFPDKIKLIKNEVNSGLAFSLNHCLEYVTGEYVARQDGDDISVENRLEILVEFLQRNKQYDLVGSKMISFDDRGINGLRGVNIQEPNKYTFNKSTPFCHATILARSYVYKNLKGYTVNKYTSRCEDVELWYRFFEKGYKGYNLEDALYMVRDDLNAYKRRSIKSYMYLIKVNFDGYRRLKMPLNKYIYLIKPLVSAIIPRSIMKIYHSKQCKNNIVNKA